MCSQNILKQYKRNHAMQTMKLSELFAELSLFILYNKIINVFKKLFYISL